MRISSGVSTINRALPIVTTARESATGSATGLVAFSAFKGWTSGLTEASSA